MNKVKNWCFFGSVNQTIHLKDWSRIKRNMEKGVMIQNIEKSEVTNIREINEAITRNLKSVLFSFSELFTRTY